MKGWPSDYLYAIAARVGILPIRRNDAKTPGLPASPAELRYLNHAAASEFDWTSAAKDALLCGSAGGFGYPPARLGLAPRFAGLWVVRAAIPTPRTNGAQTHVLPFHREVPQHPKEPVG